MSNTIKGASILITGANGGIAIETVKLLMQRQARRIVLGTRSQQKADQTKRQLADTSTTRLEAVGGFDMTDAASIRRTVSALPAHQPFDIIFLQAGGMVVSEEFRFVAHGSSQIERTIYQNVIGGYLSLQALEAANLVAPGARIVFAGGEGARGIPGMMAKPSFDSVAAFEAYVRQGSGPYSALNAIGVSKLASALLVQKLAQRQDGRSYVWFSPGLTAGTKGLDALPNPRRFLMKHMMFPMIQLFGLAQGPQKAAHKYVDALSGVYGENGDLIGAPEGKALGKLVDQKPMNPALTNHLLINAFWELIEQPQAVLMS